MTYDPVDANDDGIVESDVDNESVSTNDARISDNESLSGGLSQSFTGTTVKDDGTTVGILTESGGDHVLYRSNTPRDDNFTEVYRWSNPSTSADFIGLHYTSTGALLVAVNNEFYRSTDDGDSFTAQESLNDGRVWSWTENENGSILAAPRDALTIYQSTDDGRSWTEYATASDFPRYGDHIHKVRYHSENPNYLIVTGGDDDNAVYFSPDDGTSWKEYDAPFGQYVSVTPDPTDENTWILGHDSGGETGNALGVERWTYNGGDAPPTREYLQDFSIISPGGSLTLPAGGSFNLTTVQSPSGDNASFYIGTSVNREDDLLWVSESLEATNWRAIDYVSDRWVDAKAQAPYESVADIDTIDTLTGYDRWVNLRTATDALYGLTPRTSVPNVFGDVEGNRANISGTANIAQATRLNALLSHKQKTFADTKWQGATQGSDLTTAVTGIPRRMQVQHDGSSLAFGGIVSDAVITEAENGAFAVEISNLTYSRSGANNELRVGLSNQGPDTNVIGNGSGFFIVITDTAEVFYSVENGANESTGTSTSLPADLTFVYTGSKVLFYVDGNFEASLGHTTTALYRPVIQYKDAGNGNAETIEYEDIAVTHWS